MATAPTMVTEDSGPIAAAMIRSRAPVTVDATHMAPDERAQWDKYVLAHREATFFHLSAWRATVRRTFKHRDIYLCARRRARIVGVLPMFGIRSRVGGRMLVSVPYGVGGGIIADDDEVTAALFDRARDIAARRRCSVIDLRSARAAIPDLPVVERYVGFKRDLPRTPGEVLRWLPRKARAAARNGRQRFGLRVHYGPEHLKAVWRLYTRSMRRLSSLAYPYTFFEELQAEAPDNVWTSIVEWRGKTVAGLVTLLFRDTVMPYFIGTTNLAKKCSAANFIYLAAMERAVDEGYRIFDFGRSRRDNEGSYNFKRFSGFEPQTLGYQQYVAEGAAPPELSPSDAKYRFARRVWPKLPLFVTRSVGAYLAKQIPG